MYHALPLAKGPDLAGSLAALRTEVPAAAPAEAPRRIPIDGPLDIDDLGLLAVLNDPELRQARGVMDQARASLLQASLLPNPTASVSYAALTGGNDKVPAWTASIAQDITSIITYHPRVKSARFERDSVNADLLWQEWQIAQRARLLALDLYWGEESLRLGRRQLELLSQELEQVQAATRDGNLDLSALAPLLAAKASAEQLLAAQSLNELQSWQALDALLGLAGEVRFAIAAPQLPPVPADVDSLIARLPERRPDLIALQLGYASADEAVRAAIIGQFPAFLLGAAWGQDTGNVRSIGPTATFDVPLFDRGQGKVAAARATRLALHEEYQSRLDAAVGTTRGLIAQIERLASDSAQARSMADSAESMSQAAQQAYAQAALDQRARTDYETTALQRQIEAVALERTLGEDQITLTIELGLGLPQTRIAPSGEKSKP
ncbi:MAG TPA: TolC family protein [Steroidobacteraceae bacterium]|nr:TolC family protein [Steroidobacteraceae bacterium]